MLWTYDHREMVYLVSLRSNNDNVDVSAIAKKLGGGGHKKAAAFKYKGNIENILET